MNPFDLPGPAFLLVYTLYGAVVLVALSTWRRWRESGAPPRIDVADPYLIAMLRGGRDEAIRVAILSLVDRQLLDVKEAVWRTTGSAGTAALSHPLEKALVVRFSGGDHPISIRDDKAIDRACAELAGTLEWLGLLAGEEIRAARNRRALVGVVALLLPGLYKVGLAFSRGHSNVLFLFMLMFLFLLLAIAIRGERITERGKRVVADLQSLFEGLSVRAGSIRPGGATSELALLAGVFGLAEVPRALLPDVPELTARSTGAGAGHSFTSSSSTCSSSSCGSSCGGGCGGGCGGCGS